ncbi:MAG: FAD-dependent oxidoreductase [Sphingomonas sp.]
MPTANPHTFDLAVVGFGAAGSAAALTAARQGARVALLEKQPADAHFSSTRLSGGLIATVTDVDAAMPYLERCAGGLIPAEHLRRWAERAARLPEWLREIGLPTRRIAGGWYPRMEGADAVGVLSIVKGGADAGDHDDFALAARAGSLPAGLMATGRFGNGRDLADALEAAVHGEPGITVLHAHAAARLLRAPDGAVNGVEALTPSGTRRIPAARGVILCCGGFEFDEALKRDFLKAFPMHFYGCRASTGDGIRMAQEAGAALWHMGQIVGKAVAHFDHDGEPMNFNITIGPPGYAITDRYGRRFANEHAQAASGQQFYHQMLMFDSDLLAYPRIPSFWFFDRRRMESGPIANPDVGLVGSGLYAWSGDNRRELERGWIATGATVEDAARAAGVLDPAAAARAIADYNRACRTGRDRFGRPGESLVPLEPPFYCMPLWPGGACTCGGPQRDPDARIVGAAGKPIAGLFAAGELGEVVGLAAPSGGANLSDGLCFGQIAAETALRDHCRDTA